MTRWFAAEAAQSTRRILLATYYFPPDAAVGALRMARFARTLPEFGWEPTVVTIEDRYRDQGLDLERMKGLEQTAIINTRECPRLLERVLKLPGRLRRRRRSAADVDYGDTVDDSPGDVDETFGLQLKRWAISLAVLLPDDKKHWAYWAAVTALLEIPRRRIECVMTSGPPFSTHVIGFLAKRVLGVRWIADFRDPWIDMLPYRFPHTRSLLSDRVERWMEARTAGIADIVVLTTARMQEAFRTRYPQIPPERFVCIPNCIDTDRLQTQAPESKYDVFTITYTGSLYFHRTPEPLFRAVAELIQSGRISVRDIKMKFVGRCSHVNGIGTAQLARQYGLDAIVDVLDVVPYSDAATMMRRSHLLLVLAPERHQLVVPAKVYDYLGSGSKILAIAEEGATFDLMRDTGAGAYFASTDVDGLRRYLDDLLVDQRFRKLKNDATAFTRYDVRRLTGQLAGYLSAPNGPPATEVAVRR